MSNSKSKLVSNISVKPADNSGIKQLINSRYSDNFLYINIYIYIDQKTL